MPSTLVEHRFAKAGVRLIRQARCRPPDGHRAIRGCSSTPSSICCSTRATPASPRGDVAIRVRRDGRRRRDRGRGLGNRASRSPTSGARSSPSSRPRRGRGAPASASRSRTRSSPVTAAALVFSRRSPRGHPRRDPPAARRRRLRVGVSGAPGSWSSTTTSRWRGPSAEGLVDRGYDAVAGRLGPRGDRPARRRAIRRAGHGSADAQGRRLELLAASRKLDPDRPVIVMTAYSAIDTAVESIRQGAYHYLTKPFKQDELAIFLDRALDEVRVKNEASALRTALRAKFSVSSIIGHSPAIQAVRERIQRVADAPAPVIVLGETGTGKGLVARALHADSRRARAAVRFGQLRRAARAAARERAVRLRQGRLHRGGVGSAGTVRRGRRAARCSSTRSARCRRRCRRSCCTCSRAGPCARSGRPRNARSTCASSPPRTGTWSRPRAKERSARTCSTGSTSSPSSCPPCATVARTSRRCWNTS